MKTGEFGTIYTQFKDKPKEAIRFLMKKQEGEAVNALYRTDIGYIDIVWGDANKGLKHIIDKHGKEIKQLGFNVEDFIPIVVQYGELNLKASNARKKVFESRMFRLVVMTNYKGKSKQWLLTAFDLRPIIKKRLQ